MTTSLPGVVISYNHTIFIQSIQFHTVHIDHGQMQYVNLQSQITVERFERLLTKMTMCE